MAGLILLVAAAIFFLMGEVETERAAADMAIVQDAKTSSGREKSGFLEVIASAEFRRMAPLGMVNHGAFLALQTLWAGPWMITVLHMSGEQTSRILFVFNLSLMFGYLGLGYWAPRHVSIDGKRGWSTVRAVTVGLTGAILMQLAIVIIAAPWAWLLWIPLAIFVTVTTLVQSHVSLSFPPSLAGRANTAYNLMLFIGAFTVQWGVGLLIDAFTMRGTSPASAMRAAFSVCLTVQTAGLIAFVLNRPSQKSSAA
jgi:hypothetical protein